MQSESDKLFNAAVDCAQDALVADVQSINSPWACFTCARDFWRQWNDDLDARLHAEATEWRRLGCL